MEKKLMRIGNSWGIILNSTILKLLKIDPRTDYIKLSIKQNKLIIGKH